MDQTIERIKQLAEIDKKQFFNIAEVKKVSKGFPKDVFLCWDYHKERKAYLNNGTFYQYEFCGNMNYVIRSERKITFNKKKSDYCLCLTQIVSIS